MSERARAKNQQNQSIIHSKCYMYGRSPQQNRCGRAIREVNRQPTRILVHQSRPDGRMPRRARVPKRRVFPGGRLGTKQHQNLNFGKMLNFKLSLKFKSVATDLHIGDLKSELTARSSPRRAHSRVQVTEMPHLPLSEQPGKFRARGPHSEPSSRAKSLALTRYQSRSPSDSDFQVGPLKSRWLSSSRLSWLSEAGRPSRPSTKLSSDIHRDILYASEKLET